MERRRASSASTRGRGLGGNARQLGPRTPSHARLPVLKECVEVCRLCNAGRNEEIAACVDENKCDRVRACMRACVRACVRGCV
eukprot:2711326-Pleurochrysis_carterae.AAC.1